jgi:NADH:ubiquinone oxidoreductase subunit F (NADH-binding)
MMMTSSAPRLLRDDLTGPGLVEHLRAHGPLPALDGPALLDEVEAAGLTGRGGARFPVARKLRAVAAGSRPVVVANGAEGEPASSKDKTLLTRSPHLVLDGVQVAAAAVGARRAVVYVHQGSTTPQVRRAVAERAHLDRVRVEVVEAPEAFLSGEETAVVGRINGRAAVPRAKPPMVFAQGVDGRPTLVQNVESLSHLALIARHGAGWFRAAGLPDEPGTMLCSVSGDVTAPTVVEVPIGTPVRDILAAAGGPAGELRGLLVGGYHGAWLRPADVDRVRMSFADLKPLGASPGAGVLVVLGPDRCPLELSARVVEYLAQQSARQCGPCLNGLPALADAFHRFAGRRWDPALTARVEQLGTLLAGRGACHHPDGTLRFVRSVLDVFADELAAHQGGGCLAGA